MRLVLLALLLATAGQPAVACSPGVVTTLDVLPSANAVIVIAKVTSVSVVPSNANGACLNVSYAQADAVFGSVADTFEVSTCFEDVTVDEMTSSPGAEDFGYNVGATVLVGLIKTASEPPALRYAMPSCWGPLHRRLDTIAAEDREALLSSLKIEVSDRWHLTGR
jgi:hypothetical protein